MATLQAIWSNEMLFATVGSAVVSLLLMIVCLIAGLCPCREPEEPETEPQAGPAPSELVDYGWMRAA